MSRKLLYTLSGIYLYIPLAIFLIGWTYWWIGMPLALAGAAVCLKLYHSMEDGNCRVRFGSVTSECIIFGVLLLWTLHAGIGEFCWQNRGDHLTRNASFYTLVDMSWPAIKGSEMFSYYFGFWLPSAVMAKLSGSMLIGRLTLVIWATAGLWLAVRLIFDMIGSVKLRILLVFVFFSGIDVIPFYLYGHTIDKYIANDFFTPQFGGYSPLAWWTDHTAQPYWVYNQVIPAWLGTMLVVGRTPGRTTPLILSLMLISCPFSSIGLLPVAIYRWISSARHSGSMMSRLKSLFGWPLIVGALLAIPVIALYLINTSVGGVSLYPLDSPLRLTKAAGHILILMTFEVLVFIPFIWKWVKNDRLFQILLATSVGALFIRMGLNGMDFPSRVAIPMILYLSVMVARFTCNWKAQNAVTKVAFTCVALLALPGPMCEVVRTSYKMCVVPRNEWSYNELKSIFDPSYFKNHFVASDAKWIFGPATSSQVTPISAKNSN